MAGGPGIFAKEIFSFSLTLVFVCFTFVLQEILITINKMIITNAVK
jgi:hypothetical protein